MRSGARVVALLLLAALSCAKRDAMCAPGREPRIAGLQALGRVEVDEGWPGRPVVGLELSGPRVTDARMEEVAGLTQLRTLKLEDTRVTDEGIRRLRGLTRLRTLYLDGVAISDEGMASLASLEGLEVLALCDTRVTGPGLEHLKSLGNLEILIIEGSLTTVAGLERLGGLTRLHLANTRLTDHGLDPLLGLAELRELSIDDETVTDAGLKRLQAMPGLEKLGPRFPATTAGLDEFQRSRPDVQLILPQCGTARAGRAAELEERRLRRQGLTGRLRLAWRSLANAVW